MRIMALPEGIFEKFANMMNLLPVPIAEGVFGMMLSRVIMAGVRLGLFEALGTERKSANDLATQLTCNRQGITILADVLYDCGYLHRKGIFYSNTPLVKKWLLPTSSYYIGNYIKFNYDQWNWWSRLEEIIMQGNSLDVHDNFTEEQWHRYIYGMKDIALFTSVEIVSKVPVQRGAKRLLDLAGGHGMYSIAMCRKYPNLQATIFDLDKTAQIGREIIEREGFSGRISYNVGDLRREDFGFDYDIIFIFNILHHFSPEVNSSILNKAYESISPAGTLVICEPLKAKPGSVPNQLALLLSLNFFIMSGSDTYSYEDVRAWMQTAGFGNFKKINLRSAPGLSLILGKK